MAAAAAWRIGVWRWTLLRRSLAGYSAHTNMAAFVVLG